MTLPPSFRILPRKLVASDEATKQRLSAILPHKVHQQGRTHTAKLGHGKATSNLSIQKRRQILFLLLGVTVSRKDFHVSGIWGGAVGSLRSDDRSVSHNLAEYGVLSREKSQSIFARPEVWSDVLPSLSSRRRVPGNVAY